MQYFALTKGQMFRGIPGVYWTSGYTAVIFSAHLVAVKCEIFTTTSTREIQQRLVPEDYVTKTFYALPVVVNALLHFVVVKLRFYCDLYTKLKIQKKKKKKGPSLTQRKQEKQRQENQKY